METSVSDPDPEFKKRCNMLNPVFRNRISFHADPDPDPGSQKCQYGPIEANTKEEELHTQNFN